MTKPSRTVAVTDPPPQDWRDSVIKPADTGAGPRDSAELRACEAECRATAAEDRANAAERRIEALERALDSRGPIDQAKGLIMGIFALSADDAFDTLVWVSQSANVKVAAVAERFIAEAATLDLSFSPQEELTRLLASISRPDSAHFS